MLAKMTFKNSQLESTNIFNLKRSMKKSKIKLIFIFIALNNLIYITFRLKFNIFFINKKFI